MAKNKLTIPVDVSIQNIQDTLCSAFEGGSNYWYRIEEFGKPDKIENYSTRWSEDEKPTVFKHLDYPTNPGGYLIVSDKPIARGEGLKPTYTRVDLESIQKGISVMAKKYPHHFKNFVSDDGDAETGDVLLQCIVFGKIVYG